MNRRERMRRCYFHEELDRPAVYSRDGFPPDDPTYDALHACLAERTELKGHWSARSLLPPCPTDVHAEPYSEDFERRVTVLHTPAGDLRSSRLVSLGGRPGMDESHFLTDRADAEKYLSLPRPRPSGGVEGFFAADRRIGDAGIVQVSLGFNPAGAVAELFGSEAFAIMSATDRDVLHALCEREMEILADLIRYVTARGAGPFFCLLGEEYVVPPMHGPADFRDFNTRYDRPLADLIHEAGGRLHVHCHGSVGRVLPDFIQIGVDVLHPFEAPPMGDVTPAQAKQTARGRICLEGNIQIADMYEASPAAIREQTWALIADCFDDRRGLIVSPTASPYVRSAGGQCLPQYVAMIDEVLGWRP